MRWNVADYQENVFRQLDLRVSPRDRILDLGCGDGNDALWFAAQAGPVIGVDLLPHPRWAGLARPGLQFMQGDATNLDFPDGSFDLVFLKDVLHHTPEPARALREARRLCAPGGRVCVVEGNRFNPIFYLHMTLMLGHQHFPRPTFHRLVAGVFANARFVHFEAHVYPISSGRLLEAVHALEQAAARIPLVRRVTSYNAAIATCG